MTENIDLKKIEKKAWTTNFQDGLWDIFLGLILLNFGIAPFVEEITDINYLLWYTIVLIIAFIIFYGGKKYITTPRLGKAEFSAERKTKKKKATIVLTISVIFGIIVFLIATVNALIFKNNIYFGAILFGFNAIVILNLMAYFLSFNRLYLYGWFFAGSIVLVELSRSYVGLSYDNVFGFGVFGGIMILIGLIYLIRFIQKYPSIHKEILNGN